MDFIKFYIFLDFISDDFLLVIVFGTRDLSHRGIRPTRHDAGQQWANMGQTRGQHGPTTEQTRSNTRSNTEFARSVLSICTDLQNKILDFHGSALIFIDFQRVHGISSIFIYFQRFSQISGHGCSRWWGATCCRYRIVCSIPGWLLVLWLHSSCSIDFCGFPSISKDFHWFWAWIFGTVGVDLLPLYKPLLASKLVPCLLKTFMVFHWVL